MELERFGIVVDDRHCLHTRNSHGSGIRGMKSNVMTGRRRTYCSPKSNDEGMNLMDDDEEATDDDVQLFINDVSWPSGCSGGVGDSSYRLVV